MEYISEEILVSEKVQSTEIVRVLPKTPPVLVEQWVVWEYKFCLETNGIKIDMERLHDLVKADLQPQGVPIDIFFSNDACWIIEGARGRAKVDDDRRPRVIATLKNSFYTDMQFIAGIDYFGSSNWADVQMMLIVQPEEIKQSPRPTPPQESHVYPLIPSAALIVLGLIALGLMFSGNGGLVVLGFIGVLGVFYLASQSNQNVIKAQKNYQSKLFAYQEDLAEWEREKEQLALEREELIKNRLSRSFKTDDLRVFHTVMTRTIARIISEEFLKQGAAIKESVETNNAQNAIASSKNIFDEF